MRGVANSVGFNAADHMGWNWRTGGAQGKPVRNTHTEGYDDDGSVITMTLSKFFSGLSDYSSFLNNGARAYISLTNDEGDEVFQFGLVEKFNGDINQDMSDLECNVFSRGKVSQNIQILTRCITDSDKPFLLKSPYHKIYGVLYPSVTVIAREIK